MFSPLVLFLAPNKQEAEPGEAGQIPELKGPEPGQRAPAVAPDREAAPCDSIPERRDSFGDPLPLHAVARCGTLRFRHGTWLAAVRYDPDGRGIAAGDRDGYIRMWEAGTGKERWATRPYRTVDCLAFSPRGKLLASAGPSVDGSVVILWDPITGREVSRPVRTKERIHALAFSPDGKLLAVAIPNEHVVRVLEAASGKPVFRVESFCTTPDGLCFSPDGSLLAGPGIDGSVRLWKARTGEEVLRLGEHPGRGEAVHFSPDGIKLAVVGPRSVGFFTVADGKMASRLDLDSRDSSGPTAYTPDGKMVLAGEVGAVRLWDVSTGKEVRRLGRYSGSVISLSVSPDGKTVAVGSTDRAVRLMEIATGTEVFPEGLKPHIIQSASLSPDGDAVVTSVNVGKVAVWEVGSAKPRWVVSEEDDAHTSGVSFSPDGKVIAVGCSGGVRVRDVGTGGLVRGWQAQKGSGTSVAFSPDGRSLACTDLSNTVPISDVAAGRVRFQVSGPDRWVKSGVYTPDGRFLATVSTEGALRLWDTANGEARRSLPTRAGGVLGIACSPDSRMLASGGRGGEVVVWELISRGERVRLKVGANEINALAFAPGSRVVATGDSEGVIRLYDLSDGKERLRLGGHRGSVTKLEFSRDGRLLLSVSEDTTALVWEVPQSDRDGAARPPVRLSARQVEALWADLAERDATKAYQAILALAAAKESVPFIRERLVASSATHLRLREQIEQLIAALGSEQFAEREQATAALKAIRDDAEPWLRRAATSDLPEVRQRAAEVLNGLARLPPEPGMLRALRAIEALELIATPEARAALQALVDGVPEFRVTQATEAAVRRMSAPPSNTP
jgi:WD40 repeat protein